MSKLFFVVIRGGNKSDETLCYKICYKKC